MTDARRLSPQDARMMMLDAQERGARVLWSCINVDSDAIHYATGARAIETARRIEAHRNVRLPIIGTRLYKSVD